MQRESKSPPDWAFIEADHCLFDSEEIAWIRSRYPDSRFGEHRIALAVTLKYFQLRNRYPSHRDLPPAILIKHIATQLGYPQVTLQTFDWHYSNKTLQRFRVMIRKKLQYHSITFADGLQFIEWFKTHVSPTAPTPIQSQAYAEEYFTEHHIEPPTPERLERHIQSAQTQFEATLFETLSAALPDDTKRTFDALLIGADTDVCDSPDANTPAVSSLYRFKQSLRVVDPSSLSEFIDTLENLSCLTLPKQQLKTYQRKLLLKYHQRILAEAPSEIQAHPDAMRHGMLAIFCYIQQQVMIDTLAQTFIDVTHKIQIRAQAKIKQAIISDVACVKGKFDILHRLADLAANTPEGIIEETIYPTVTQDTLRDLAKELKHRGHWYEQTVKAKMCSLYSHHHRRLLLPMIKALTLHAQHTDYQPIVDAVNVILKQAESTLKQIPSTDEIPVEGVVKKSWLALVVEPQAGEKPSLINRFYYELAVYETLRDKLDCKSVWVEGAYRYRNPEEDLPQDFDGNKNYYFDLLKLPRDGDRYIQDVQRRMRTALTELDDGLPNNKKVKITMKNNKPWIKISTSDPQALPDHIDDLKAEVTTLWPTLGLLEVFKETAIRTSFPKHFHTVCDYENLKPEVLWKRLLLCLYGMGTNTGLKHASSGNCDVTYSDLRYIKRRFITPCRIRAAIAELVDQTLALRDSTIWGECNVTVACDSKKVNVWDRNLMSQFHPRYKGTGVMIYWHVDQKSLCIHSQLKTCLSSEVASMMQGVLHHGTKMDVKAATMDTHGQSLPGFAFSDLLYFTLLPRIKGIQREKLFLSDEACRHDYPHLDLILGAPIDWQLVRDNYEAIVKYAAALKLGMVDSDIILKRFKATNYQHPVYRALIELGKAIKTIFLCRYLHSEDLRIDINASQNVVERVNGFMDFIFYGKLGEISTNKQQDQELAILCLHLLEASLIYINTLLIQQVLSTPAWRNKLTVTDKRAITPLIHGHINPYGLCPLDMESRINIETPTANTELHYAKNLAQGACQTVC